MAYCNQDDLLKLIPEEELAEITTESGGTPDAAVISEAIAKADSEIDAYCGVRYSVPFNPVPTRIKSLSEDLAIYHLYSRRSVAPEIRRQKYVDAIVLLKAIAQGSATLSSSGDSPAATGREVADLTTTARLFTRTSLGKW